ncbi:hypothetical protein BHE74_00049271, partial [Ensete ventricosum]
SAEESGRATRGGTRFFSLFLSSSSFSLPRLIPVEIDRRWSIFDQFRQYRPVANGSHVPINRRPVHIVRYGALLPGKANLGATYLEMVHDRIVVMPTHLHCNMITYNNDEPQRGASVCSSVVHT